MVGKLKELLTQQEQLKAGISEIMDSVSDKLKPLEDSLKSIDTEIMEIATGHAKIAFLANGHDTGTEHITADGVQIKATISKRVEWNQKVMASIYHKIHGSGDDPLQYMNLKYDVPEKSFTAWPEQIKNVFLPARTVKPSAPKFEFIILDDDSNIPPF